MSEQNIEVLRRLVDAYNRGDKEAFLAELHADAEAIPIPQWPEPGPYVRERIWDFYMQAEDVWGTKRGENPSLDDFEIIPAKDKLFLGVARTMHGRGSDAPVEFQLYAAATFRDGKLARIAWFLEREPALEAAGLAE